MNVTETLFDDKNASSPPNYTFGAVPSRFPFPVVVVYILILCAGTCANVFFSLVLMSSRRNGVLTVILQLTFVDAAALFIAVTEILSVADENWTFPSSLCSTFLGSEVLIANLTKYLLICLNFHAISLWNLHAYEKQTTSRNPLTSESESNECLVSKAENLNSRTVDYRRRKSDVSVILPTVLVWFVCVSLSIPEYALSSTLKIADDVVLCTVIDLYYGPLLQNLLLVFRVFVPLPLMCVSLVALLVKLCKHKVTKSPIENVLDKKTYKIESLLTFCVVITCAYVCLSVQREVLYFLHVFARKYVNENAETFMMPPLRNLYVSAHSGAVLSMLNYTAAVTRPLLYLYLLPKFRFLVKSKVMCTERKKSAA